MGEEQFNKYKKHEILPAGFGSLLGDVQEQASKKAEREFENGHPGVRQEFEYLIDLLPNPDDPSKKEFPFAASVVRFANGKMEVLARSTNLVNARNDSTQHAEFVVIQEAQKKLDNKHLDGCVLLSTAQPCEMCSGAIRNTQINTLVYGVSQKELRDTHVKFGKEFKKIRATSKSIDTDNLLREEGVKVLAGYKYHEVIKKLSRFVGTIKEYYEDSDA